jgi:hypothetical protein
MISNVTDRLFSSKQSIIIRSHGFSISDCITNNVWSHAMLLEEAAVAFTCIFPLLGLGF